MIINIMDQYIELTRKQIEEYLKLVFENRYEKKFCNMYTDTYINARYYNFFGNAENMTKRKIILEELRKTQEYMISSNIQEQEVIQQMYVFFTYILYFDNVVYYKDLRNKISKINRLRKRVLNIASYEFEENLYKKLIQIQEEKEKLLGRFESNEFSLKITNYKDKLNIYKVNLKHNIKFPMEYSELAIDKVFNMGIINEDRLTIEYCLITVQAIKDMIKQNFRTQYIVEFAETLLDKPKKLNSLLNIIDNVAVQDKISLKIRHEHFIEKREKVYELMREGYKFSIILDNSFEVNYKNMENLKMFKFVLLSKDSKQYEEIKQFNNEVNNNIIEI